MSDSRWRWVILAAVLWYCCWAILFIRARPGFQYDEAIDVLGSVSLLHSHEELKLPHAPETWFCVAEHCFPLMSARYIGSVKEYLCLPLFAIFGPRAEVVRMLAMTLGAVGILGIATLLASQAGYAAAAAGAWLLAANPSYLDMTIFDNSAFSPWMFAVGLLCFAAAAYLKKPSAWRAFWVGAAIGWGVWTRANYVWMLGAIGVALLLCLGRRLLVPLRQWLGFVAGGLAGGAPFIAYQILSGGGTWQAVSMFSASGTWVQRIQHRVWMLSETVLSNGEHHRIWGGPADLPVWQSWLFPLVILVCCGVCLRFNGLPRVAGLTLLFYIAAFFYTSLPIGEHHLMTLMPIAAMVVVLGWQRMAPPHVLVTIIFAGIYAGSAIYWDAQALEGLRRTGGVGPWSDAIYTLAQRLDFPGREIKVLDWGLQNSIYVLSDGRVRTRELFWDSTVDHTDWNGPWIEEIRHGGVFLLEWSAESADSGDVHRIPARAGGGKADHAAVHRGAAERDSVCGGDRHRSGHVGHRASGAAGSRGSDWPRDEGVGCGFLEIVDGILCAGAGRVALDGSGIFADVSGDARGDEFDGARECAGAGDSEAGRDHDGDSSGRA